VPQALTAHLFTQNAKPKPTTNYYTNARGNKVFILQRQSGIGEAMGGKGTSPIIVVILVVIAVITVVAGYVFAASELLHADKIIFSTPVFGGSTRSFERGWIDLGIFWKK
jgi:hypothetical protein